mmetsp:Transcript_8325/g.23908  ORF Transcript_8325/g.23908 Transcript_8325/m.23908 type:complete len:293 (-) Transcript_8325:58-936(-)
MGARLGAGQKPYTRDAEVQASRPGHCRAGTPARVRSGGHFRSGAPRQVADARVVDGLTHILQRELVPSRRFASDCAADEPRRDEVLPARLRGLGHPRCRGHFHQQLDRYLRRGTGERHACRRGNRALRQRPRPPRGRRGHRLHRLPRRHIGGEALPQGGPEPRGLPRLRQGPRRLHLLRRAPRRARRLPGRGGVPEGARRRQGHDEGSRLERRWRHRLSGIPTHARRGLLATDMLRLEAASGIGEYIINVARCLTAQSHAEGVADPAASRLGAWGRAVCSDRAAAACLARRW